MTSEVTRKYSHVLSPIRVKNLMITNRLCSSPMGTIPTHVTISSTNYGGVSIYDKAAGGVGMVCLIYHGQGGVSLYEANGGDPFSNKYELDILRDQLNVARSAGALAGLDFGMTQIYENTLYTPSGLPFAGRTAMEMPEDIIEKQVDHTVEKAVKAMNFGFDFLILDICSDNIVAQFMAPAFNKRQDKWGGTIENRMRLPIYLVNRVREAVGDNVVIMLRLSVELGIEGSYSMDETLQMLKSIEGRIDIVNTFLGMDEYHESNVIGCPVIFEPHLNVLNYAKRIKQETNMLVCLGGGVMTPGETEKVISEGDADFVMLGRSLIADPYWPKKLCEGREDDIVPCIRCNQCYHIASQHFNVACSVNPRYRRENIVPLKLGKADVLKKVVVVGAGPAGITAALTAEQRGHSVVLIEKDNQVGGLLNRADFGQYKIDLRRYNNYLKTQLNKSTVEVMLNTIADRALIETMYPDAIIVAIGSSSIKPNIEGIDSRNVIQAIDILPNIEKAGQNVIVIGGGSVGCETALDLVDHNKNVVIVEMDNELARNGNMLYRVSLMQHINNKPLLSYMCNSLCHKITDNSVIVSENGEIKELPADTVVLAVGMKSNSDNIEEFFGICPQTYYVGDCKNVATVLQATNDSYFIAANL